MGKDIRFEVVDRRTGKLVSRRDLNDLVADEIEAGQDWCSSLACRDVDGFLVDEDGFLVDQEGNLYVVDGCNNIACPPQGLFEVVTETPSLEGRIASLEERLDALEGNTSGSQAEFWLEAINDRLRTLTLILSERL